MAISKVTVTQTLDDGTEHEVVYQVEGLVINEQREMLHIRDHAGELVELLPTKFSDLTITGRVSQ